MAGAAGPWVSAGSLTLSGVGLESSREHPQPLRRVTAAVRGWIDRLGTVWVEGQLIEISRRPTGRTVFMTMRDPLANVSASIAASTTTLTEAGPLTEGATVVARLKPSYYETAGRFSFYCDAISLVGEGQLLARLEQTKRLLQAEGLFDPARKKRLPFLPAEVGLITGADSAAERDVCENARRRWPAVRIRVRHALVQGPSAAEQLMAALAELDGRPQVEVIVVARGGGSLEDLLPFSDEGLVRAVYACRTPVVSAIGHETDTPLLDLVADHRASTPTDAAKRVVPDVAEEAARLAQARHRLRIATGGGIQRQRDWLAALRSRPVLADPTASFALRRGEISGLRVRAERAVTVRLAHESSAVEHTLARVRAVSPKATLERGYAILVADDGSGVTSVTDVQPGDGLAAYLADGRLRVSVTGIAAEVGS